MKDILIATTKDYQNNELFNLSNTRLNRDNCLEPYATLREGFRKLGYDLKTMDMGNAENADHIIFNEVGYLKDYYEQCVSKELQSKMILIIWEPPVVSPDNYSKEIHANFSKIFTWKDDLVDGKKYLKLHWPQPSYSGTIPDIPFKEKKMLTLIAGNKTSDQPDELYSSRLDSIRYFSSNHPQDFTFYGMGWERNTSIFNMIKEMFFPSEYRCYGGNIEDKLQTLARFKYCICYENMKNIKGWITEKIFDCFKAGCVPIYWGAENIADYIPDDCFIDRRKFKDHPDLARYISDLGKNEHGKYQDSIRNFLKSVKYIPFTAKAFSDTIVKGVLGQ